MIHFLSNGNLEVRDQYFSRLKYSIELNLKVNKKKTVLVGLAQALEFIDFAHRVSSGFAFDGRPGDALFPQVG